MARQSVQRRAIVSHPDFIYTESDPFERATARLNGIAALEVVVDCALETEGGPTAKVWMDLWYFIRLATEDIKRDMYEMEQSSIPTGAQA